MNHLWNDCPICGERLFISYSQFRCDNKCYIVNLRIDVDNSVEIVSDIINLEEQDKFYQVRRMFNTSIFYDLSVARQKSVIFELKRVVEFDQICTFEKLEKLLNKYRMLK